MRASRLLSIVLLLQTRGRMTAPELADQLEVSVRSIYRDVDSLSAAGVPVYADRGPTGGYQLLAGYRTRLTGLTADEAESLSLAGLPGPAAELGLGTVLAAAQLKLLAALPPELRPRATRIRERFLLEAPGWFNDPDQPPHLAEIADAVWNQRTLQIRYRRWGGEVTRTVQPLGLVLKGGIWYLAAAVEEDPRTYRISRILELETLAERFDRPQSFDLAAYWQSWSDGFTERVYRQQALVRLSPLGFELLPHYFDAGSANAARDSASPPDQDGWRQVAIPILSVRTALGDMLRFGLEAEVVAPPELRSIVAETAARLAKTYALRSRESGAALAELAGADPARIDLEQ
ncbi:MAG: helix-turn-helix transcriptional regulator [Thermomicrobiales bacterium]